MKVVEYNTLVLTPLLSLATFLLTRELTSNDKVSILSSFLTIISFQTMIGIYSGFYANWLALIIAYLAFVLLLKCLKRPSKFKSVGLALLLTGVLLAHSHTWIIVIIVAFVFAFVLHAMRYYPKKHFIILYVVLSSSVLVDVAKWSILGTSTGIEGDVSIGLSHGLGAPQFTERYSTIIDTVLTYYGGAYANIAILTLVAYWLVRCRPRELVNIFILIFISTGLIPLFLGDWVLQSRILFDIPFQIPAAISAYALWKGNQRLMSIGIILIASYISLHVLANLGYVPPAQ